MTSDSAANMISSKKSHKLPKNQMKLYEKNRRDRFNRTMDILAALLPKYNKENPWSKKEILDHTIAFINSRDLENERTEELMKKLIAEIRNLKEIIVAFTEFKYQKYDIFKLSSVKIKNILKQLSEHNNKLFDNNTPESIKSGAGDLVTESLEETEPSFSNGVRENADEFLNPVLVETEHSYSNPILKALDPMLPNPRPTLSSKTNMLNSQVVVSSSFQVLQTGQQPILPAPPLPNPDITNQPIILKAYSGRPIAMQSQRSATNGSQQFILSRGAKKFILNGTQVIPILPALHGNISTTSTVTVNTGSKSSVIELVRIKRPYLKRKYKASAKPADDSKKATGQKDNTGDQVLGGQSVGSSQELPNSCSTAKDGATGNEANPAGQSNKAVTRSSTTEYTVDCTSTDAMVSRYQTLVHQVQSDLPPPQQSGPLQQQSLARQASQAQSLLNCTQSFESSPIGESLEQASQILPMVSSGSLDQPAVEAHTGLVQQVLNQDYLDRTLSAGQQSGVTAADPLMTSESGAVEDELERSLVEEMGGTGCKLPRLELNQHISITDKEDLDGLEELKKIECAGSNHQKRLETSEELHIINETIKEDDYGKEFRRRREAVSRGEDRRGEKKKSKSSYSIPALCQISVNIGDRPDVSSSPGVLSLNSVGTISPSHTPVPTPDKAIMDTMKSTEDHVIEELKTIRPEELLQQVEIVTGGEDLKSSSNLSLAPATLNPSSLQYPATHSSSSSIFSHSSSSLPHLHSSLQHPATLSSSSSIFSHSSTSLPHLHSSLQHPATHSTSSSIFSHSSTSLPHLYSSIPHSTSSSSVLSHSSSFSSSISQLCSTLPLPSSNISPSQSFLTSFPLVSKHADQDSCEGVSTIQQEISQALKDLDRELNLESINTDEQDIKDLKEEEEEVLQGIGKLEAGTKLEDGSACSSLPPASQSGPTCSSLPPTSHSVYDFSCRPMSPPAPLHKGRKDSRSPRQAKEDPKKSLAEPGVRDTKPKQTEKKTGNSSSSNNPISISSGNQMMGLQTGYLENLSLEQSYGSQQLQQQQGGMKQGGNQSYADHGTTYHPGSQHSIYRNSYMTPHYHYQGVVSNQHSVNSYQHSNPYSQAGISNPEMKNQVHSSSFHQEPKYSCSTHSPYPVATNLQDFHSRNYYKNYGQSQQYRGSFNQPDPMHQQYLDRKQRQHQINQHQVMLADTSGMADKSVEVDVSGTGTFSVTQLVSSSQRKSGKKTSSTNSKPAKSKGEAEKKEREEKKSGKGSRRNRSGNRSNYSAESLLNTQAAASKEDKHLKMLSSPYKNSSPGTQDKTARSSTNWSNEVNQHFGGLPFSSLSPSPGLFSSDLSSFELGIFNPQDGTASRDYFSNPMTPQNKSSKQLTCQLTNQRSDWGINSGGAAVIDGSFLPPLPTLTPPTEDPMAYSFMSHSHSGFYPCASVTSQRVHNVYTSNSANISSPGCGTPSSMMGKGSTSHQLFPGHMTGGGISGLAGKVSNTGSLVNFNLSTIFPEINIQAAGGVNCQSKPLVGLTPIPPPEFLQGSRSSQLGTPDLISHSISLLGHPSHQVPSFSVAPGISSNMVPGLTFPNIPE